MTLFTDELKVMTAKSWEKSMTHPFVVELAEGRLPEEAFKRYLVQDMYYLNHYSKIHALAAVQAEETAVTHMLLKQAQETIAAEMLMHTEHARLLGMSTTIQTDIRPLPTAYGYTSHLYRVAMAGSLGQTIAGLLPCYWLYADIGSYYRDSKPANPLYASWLENYGSELFQRETQVQIDLLNRLAELSSEAEKEKMRDAFKRAKEYELAFWEMAYAGEQWPSEK